MSYAFDEAVGEVSIGSMAEEPMLWPTLYSIRQMSGADVTMAAWGDLSEFQEKIEGAEMTEDTLVQQAKQTLSAVTYGKVLRVTEEMIEDQAWIGASDFGEALGSKGAELYETRAALLFNNIFTTTYFSDQMGEAISANTHTDVDGNTITSYDNRHALALSFDNAMTVRNAMRRTPGYSSTQKTTIIANELLYPPDLSANAFALINSSQVPGGANNDANPFRTGFIGYEWNFLSSTTRWHMMDSRLRRRYLRAYLRIPLEIVFDAIWSQRIRKIGAYLRFVLGATNGRFVASSEP